MFGFGGMLPGAKSTSCPYRKIRESSRSKNSAQLSRWHRLVTSCVDSGSAHGRPMMPEVESITEMHSAHNSAPYNLQSARIGAHCQANNNIILVAVIHPLAQSHFPI